MRRGDGSKTLRLADYPIIAFAVSLAVGAAGVLGAGAVLVAAWSTVCAVALGYGVLSATSVWSLARRGLDLVVKKHFKGLILASIGYFILFSYMQQSLLVDGLTYTGYGVYHLRLPAGVLYFVSLTPPVPESSMPFPLWGPFASITTPYFDFAVTPLSFSLSAAVSLLTSLNVYTYLEVYRGVKKSISDPRRVSTVATATLVATSLACSCELFTGLLAAIAPVSVFLASEALLTQVDSVFVAAAVILLVSTGLALMRRLGSASMDAPSQSKVESPGFRVDLYTPMLASFGFLPYLVLKDTAGLYLSIIAALLIGLHSPATRRLWLIAAVSAIAAAPFSLAASLILTALAASQLGARWLKPKSLAGYASALVATWFLVMIGPLGLVYPPIFAATSLGVSEGEQFFVGLWLIATPFSVLYGVRTVLTFASEIKTEDPQQLKPPALLSSGFVYLALGAAIVLSQYLVFLARPGVFLTSSNLIPAATQALIPSISLIMGVAGLLLAAYGAWQMIKTSSNPYAVSFRNLVESSSGKTWFAAFFAVYFVASMYLSGNIAVGNRAPTGVSFPSVYVFTNGAPPLYEPSAVLYLSPTLGIVLVPLYLIIEVSSALLFALNLRVLLLVAKTRLNTSRYAKSSVLLAVPSAFVACPSCALMATSLYTLIGAGAISVATGVSLLTNGIFSSSILALSWIAQSASTAYLAKRFFGVSPLQNSELGANRKEKG
jgi:hypothetical protein